MRNFTDKLRFKAMNTEVLCEIVFWIYIIVTLISFGMSTYGNLRLDINLGLYVLGQLMSILIVRLVLEVIVTIVRALNKYVGMEKVIVENKEEVVTENIQE